MLIRSLCVWHPQAQTQTNDQTIVNVDAMPYDINLRKEELSTMDNLTNMSDLNEWDEITRGLYRFVLSAGACYEKHIL